MLYSMELAVDGDDPVVDDVKNYLNIVAPGLYFIAMSRARCTVYFRRSEDHRLFPETWRSATRPDGIVAEADQ